MDGVDRFTSGLIEHRRVAILLLLLFVGTVGTGVTQLKEETNLQEFQVGTTQERAEAYIESNFSRGLENRTVAQVVVRDDNVLDKETLLTLLAIQDRIIQNSTIGPTLASDPATSSIASVVARAAIQSRYPEISSPSIEQQITALETLEEREIKAILTRILSEESGTDSPAFALMPNDYESGTATANATMIVVFQRTRGALAPTSAPDRIVESQTAIQTVAEGVTTDEDVLVVGHGVITAETEQSRDDTLQIVGPLALLFVLVTLIVVYRDLLDIVLSLVGILLVQVWTFGALGWVGIPFNPILIAIPVLLIGLSIDYGIHVFMRYRERLSERSEERVPAMTEALGAVGVALLWVTMTTVVGFLSNLASPVKPIQDLGIISAIGIVGALVVFGVFLPPLKVELDRFSDWSGIPRRETAIGTGSGRVGKLLSVGATAARRAPFVVLILVLVVTATTTLAATQVSTSFEPEDNIPGEAPDWTGHLPDTLAPGEYSAKEDLHYTNEHFVRHGSSAEILIRGEVAAPDTLERLDAASARAGALSVTVILANGEPRTVSPLTVMDRVAAQNDSFNATFTAADTDGDGIPDRNLDGVYDALYEVRPEQAERVIHRSHGEYVALRFAVSVKPEAEGEAIMSQMRSVTSTLDGDRIQATATGRPIINQVIQDYLLKTLLTSLLITLVVITSLLAIGYKAVHGSVTLGLVTLTPVMFVVSWVIATMYAIGYPLSVLTTIVASITIGIGIDYSIHMSERFSDELNEAATIEDAIRTTTRGTGSALLGSAVTTAAGFGVLGFALHPTLQQFGTITGIMIGYAFLASVLVLPSLLTLWARYFGPGQTTRTERKPTVGESDTVDD